MPLLLAQSRATGSCTKRVARSIFVPTNLEADSATWTWKPFREHTTCLLNQPNHWIVLHFWIHLGPLAIACWSLLQGVWTAGHRQFQGFPWSGTRPLTPTVVFWAESQKRKTLCKADCAKGMKTIELWFSISAISAESLLECTPAKPWQGKGQPYVWVAELWWTVSKWINSHFIGKLSSRK